MKTERFTLTAQHILLLSNANVRWDDCETGAPYGNSFVAGDVARILGIVLRDEDSPDWDEEIYEAECAELLRLHDETENALRIVLTCLTFEPGEFERAVYSSWRRVK